MREAERNQGGYGTLCSCKWHSNQQYQYKKEMQNIRSLKLYSCCSEHLQDHLSIKQYKKKAFYWISCRPGFYVFFSLVLSVVATSVAQTNSQVLLQFVIITRSKWKIYYYFSDRSTIVWYLIDFIDWIKIKLLIYHIKYRKICAEKLTTPGFKDGTSFWCTGSLF